MVQGNHRRGGIPDYIYTHCPKFRNSMRAEIHELHEAGFVTANEAAARLGIPRTTLKYLEGRLYEPVERKGKRQIRVFTEDQIEALRKALPSTRSVRRARARKARGGTPAGEPRGAIGSDDIRLAHEAHGALGKQKERARRRGAR